jgi:hypothetical protein
MTGNGVSPSAEGGDSSTIGNVVVSGDGNNGLVDSMDVASLEAEASLDVELDPNAMGNDSAQVVVEHARASRRFEDEEIEEVGD